MHICGFKRLLRSTENACLQYLPPGISRNLSLKVLKKAVPCAIKRPSSLVWQSPLIRGNEPVWIVKQIETKTTVKKHPEAYDYGCRRVHIGNGVAILHCAFHKWGDLKLAPSLDPDAPLRHLARLLNISRWATKISIREEKCVKTLNSTCRLKLSGWIVVWE